MKKVLVAVAALLMASCLGPNNAYRSLKNWNAEFTNYDTVAEVTFLSLLPVYGVLLASDVVFFNTISYWCSKDVIADPGAFPGFYQKDRKAYL